MEVRLGTFIDFVASDWTAKITCVKNAKERYGQPYTPAFDYWKALREGIEEMHQQGLRVSYLDNIVSGLTDAKKVGNYRQAVVGYKKWLGNSRLRWLTCPSGTWTAGQLTVKVNPELAVVLNGQPHVIKLWLRAGDKLTKKRVEATLHLMDTTVGANATVGILDVRRANLITPTRLIPGIDALLQAEASGFVTMWNAL